MSRLGNILKNYQPHSPFRKSVTAALVVEAANATLKEMFGDEIESLAKATSVWHRILTVACLSTTAAQGIKMEENVLISKINERLGANEVIRLKFLE